MSFARFFFRKKTKTKDFRFFAKLPAGLQNEIGFLSGGPSGLAKLSVCCKAFYQKNCDPKDRALKFKGVSLLKWHSSNNSSDIFWVEPVKNHPLCYNEIFTTYVISNLKVQLRPGCLHMAIMIGCDNIIAYLLKIKANVNEVWGYKETPLHMAAYRSSITLVKSLLDHFADPNMIKQNGETPLHVAAQPLVSSAHENVEVIQLLINSRANLFAENDQRQTPLQYARENERTSKKAIESKKAIVEILETSARSFRAM